MIHSEALSAKNLGKLNVGNLVFICQSSKFIQNSPLQPQLFSQLCNKLGSEYSNLLMYTGARWLSRRKVVERMFELQEQILLFLQARNTGLVLSVSDEIWRGKLAYLADIFNLLNGLKLSLQGRDTKFLISQNKIVVFTNSKFVKIELMTMHWICFGFLVITSPTNHQ